MPQTTNKALKEAKPYNAAITREQFLFYEIRITAKLVNGGLDKDAVVEKIVSENLFQYPTEKSVRKIALATQPSDVAKQICLYAMMRQYRLVWDFMITVIGEKYQKLDSSFGRVDLNTFFMRLQEQDDWVAAWSDSTITKVRQVLMKTLVENDYLDSTKADHLNPVMISPILENAIRNDGMTQALPAFNCLS